MARLLVPAALVMSLLGCIVYDEELVYEDGTPVDTPDDRPGDRPDRPDNPDDRPDEPEIDVALSPDRGDPGETLLVFISSADVDLADVDAAVFYGPSDLEVLAFALSEGDLAITLDIPDGAEAGANDLVLELVGGDAVFVPDAFDVR